jgi:hypothetical protein
MGGHVIYAADETKLLPIGDHPYASTGVHATTTNASSMVGNASTIGGGPGSPDPNEQKYDISRLLLV